MPLRALGSAPAAAIAALTREIDELETLPRFDRDGAGDRALLALAEARELGLPELELRAQLVRAEVLQRCGELAEGGRLAQEVFTWATGNNSRYLLARSHYVLQGVFMDLGDLSQALEHSVRAVDLLGHDARPALRIDHLVRLADCLCLNGDEVGARERYPEVLRLAEDLGDLDRQLVALNNRAYFEALTGHFDAALGFSTRLQRLADEHGMTLHVGRLDTIARALMGLGRLAEAEEVLRPGLRPELLDASPDGDRGADSLLTLAEVLRRLGRLEEAQISLDACVRTCEELGLGTIRVHARREQAELHAAAEHFQAAFEEHKVYSRDVLQLQSDQRDARAQALRAMYETSEARRQTRRYRELSLRDPLTGLYNRRYVDEELPRLLQHGVQHAVPVTLALLDLDHFKKVNDTFSHEVGDQVLRIVAGLLEAAASAADDGDGGSFAARMGGEEFLLVLVGGDPAGAVGMPEDVRRSVRSQPWAGLAGSCPLAVTVSIGATGSHEVNTPDPAPLLSRADARLYRAKRQGRDRVVSRD
ncbi:diguanylate cyclase (GGDEF) domain-containing protein [Modestobacter sp. DSM 44400]|uniref:GGDEF domain-containing protein n=1 Tax=Modestobacter sp. DSM 44400 TaxID=1550230 RepID=UPI000899FB59|nr:GGDEF domain-containing protein [Modestobacter sp. DSM 44400]SDY33258.1 diguanylate cyclase (GGDEF) domain-containing protein [Modestobacter sp. DSM 44400]